MNKETLIENPNIKNIIHFAEMKMAEKFKESGRIPTMLWCIGDKDVKAIGAMNLSSDKDKREFGFLASMMCIAEAAKATFFMGEVWVSPENTKEPMKASAHPEREEFVLLQIDLPSLYANSFYPILRGKNGKPRLGKCKQPPQIEQKCREEQHFPNEPRSESERAEAASAIKNVLGYYV